MTCPDANTIAALVTGRVAPELRSELEAHLAGCTNCRRLVGLMAASSQLAVASDAVTVSELSPRTRLMLSAGETVGRYRIERVIGAGAMGVVYAARDPELDREVALKVMPQRGGSLDEAKAMARLRHPSVVAVHDVGLHGADVFIAMEYVAGQTLREWLRTPRSAKEILGVFTQAGRGLAAAHAAGIVHRDFKPENVLVEGDNVAKVTDFGLARLANDPHAIEHTPTEQLQSTALAQTGSFAGTPAYMAPEQLATAPVDARADQFAFCVSLYEAIYGRRPFHGDTVAELAETIAAGKLEPVRGARVPRRLRHALVRGLAVDREARFPSMDALIDALSPRRQRVAFAVAGVAAVAGIALTSIAVMERGEVQPCRGAAIEIAPVWNVGRRTAVHAAFVAAQAPQAAEILVAIERGIDDYVSRWTAMQTSTCEATRVHRHQSEAVLDLRLGCLQRRRSELDALLTVFARADKDVVEHARDALHALDLAVCSDAQALAHRAAPPRDPVARARYHALRARIDRVRMLVEVTHFDAALTALDSIDAAEFAALAAEAELMRGRALKNQGKQQAAEPVLFKALASGQAIGDLNIVATAAIDLAHLTGYEAERTADGERWVALAASTIEAAGGDHMLSARLETIHARILERSGRIPEAERADRRALELVRRKAPDDRLEGEVLDALGGSLALQGKFDEAITTLEKSLAIRAKHYGEIHQLVASTRMNLANALAASDRKPEALKQFQQALVVNERLFGTDAHPVANVLGNMGMLLQETGRLDEARSALDRALVIREKLLGADHPRVARIVTSLGYVELDAKDFNRALERFDRAGAIIESALGADHPARIDALYGTGVAWLGLGKAAAAIGPLEHAVRLRERYPADPVELSELRASLAGARKSGRDRSREPQSGR
ncbi:MAG TPA: serine/threonine-protein kinase [Kofleriaceae bacterium]